MRNTTQTTQFELPSNIVAPLTQDILLDQDTAENLHNLLFQLNWLNDVMQSDRSNSIINALLLSIDPANKEQICEAIETISRINLSDSLIKKTINILENHSK